MLARLTIAVCCLLFAVAVIASADEPRLSALEQREVSAINAYRARHGLTPLVPDQTLTAVARHRVPFYDHHAFGRWSWEACHAAGFPGQATDDLCQGAISPEEAVDGWAHSPVGHAEQMRGLMNVNNRWLDYKFNRVGVAISGRNYIAIFGREN